MPISERQRPARRRICEPLALAMWQPDQLTESLHAYQLSKRANALRVSAEAFRWSKRGACVNTVSQATS
jgi:hypothetical protein